MRVTHVMHVTLAVVGLIFVVLGSLSTPMTIDYSPVPPCASDDGSGPRPCMWADGSGVPFRVEVDGTVTLLPTR